MQIEIVPSLSLHVQELTKTLREKDRIEAEGLGMEAHKAIYRAYKGACYRRTCLVDDEVAAMWGLHGELLGTTGMPYLLTGTVSERVSPLRFMKIYKQEVEIMRTFFPVLENIVDASYLGAVKALRVAGFSVSDKTVEFTPGHFFKTFRMET